MMPRNSQNSFKVGEHVLCFEPDSSKAKVLYNAKVIDVETMTDKKGKYKPMYLIHFQGWNSSWDRLVPESFLLKDTEEHRQLMAELTKICQQIRRNRLRVEKIDALLEKFFQGSSNDWLDSIKKLDSKRSKNSFGKENNEVNYDLDDANDDDEKTCSDLSTEMNLEDDTSVCSYKSENSQKSKHSTDNEEDRNFETVSLEMSIFLKDILTKDYNEIKTKNMLVKLPVEQNVISILESAVKSYCQNLNKDISTRNKLKLRNQYQSSNHSKNIDLCKETADSLRIMFDFILPLMLLYNEEQQQYKNLFELEQIIENKELVVPKIIFERRTTRKSSLNSNLVNCFPAKKRRTRSQPDLVDDVAQKSEKNNTLLEDSSTIKDSINDFNGTLNDTNHKSFDNLISEGKICDIKGNSLDSWHLLPGSAINLKLMPSSVYGAHHLLRLFVKLPQLLAEMGISNVYLPHLKHHLNFFLEYLNLHGELFIQSAYITNLYK